MSKTKKVFLATFPIEAEPLEQTLAFLTEIYQRTGFAPFEIKTSGGKRLKWDSNLALKVSTGKSSVGEYIGTCSI